MRGRALYSRRYANQQRGCQHVAATAKHVKRGRVRRSGRRRTRRRRSLARVPKREAAEYIFALIRSLMIITRAHKDFQLTTYFLEMAALEIAPARTHPSAEEATVHKSSRATS